MESSDNGYRWTFNIAHGDGPPCETCGAKMTTNTIEGRDRVLLICWRCMWLPKEANASD